MYAKRVFNRKRFDLLDLVSLSLLDLVCKRKRLLCDNKVQMIHRNFLFMVPKRSTNTELIIIIKRQFSDSPFLRKLSQQNPDAFQCNIR